MEQMEDENPQTLFIDQVNIYIKKNQLLQDPDLPLILSKDQGPAQVLPGFDSARLIHKLTKEPPTQFQHKL